MVGYKMAEHRENSARALKSEQLALPRQRPTIRGRAQFRRPGRQAQAAASRVKKGPHLRGSLAAAAHPFDRGAVIRCTTLPRADPVENLLLAVGKMAFEPVFKKQSVTPLIAILPGQLLRRESSFSKSAGASGFTTIFDSKSRPAE